MKAVLMIKGGLTPREKLVLLKIAERADHAGAEAWPSVGTLAIAALCHKRTVFDYLDKLEADEWLIRESRPGRTRSNHYTLNLAKIQQASTMVEAEKVAAAPPFTERPEAEKVVAGPRQKVAAAPLQKVASAPHDLPSDLPNDLKTFGDEATSYRLYGSSRQPASATHFQIRQEKSLARGARERPSHWKPKAGLNLVPIAAIVRVMLKTADAKGYTLSDRELAKALECRLKTSAPPIPYTDAIIGEAIDMVRAERRRAERVSK